MLIKDIKDFRMFILPIFYLLHGEPYDTDNVIEYEKSYFIKYTPSQLNIECKKCKNIEFNSLCFEFYYHNKTSCGVARDITLTYRGHPLHAFHYKSLHTYHFQG